MASCPALADTLRAVCVAPSRRLAARRALAAMAGLSAPAASDAERGIVAMTADAGEYGDHASRVVYNLISNPALLALHAPRELAALTDAQLARGTVVEEVRRNEEARSAAFAEMLHDRYEAVRALARDSSSLLHCRGCGSTDISWRQVQTRSADESMTVFTTCLRCGRNGRLS